MTFKEFVRLSEDEQRAWRHQVLDLEEDRLAEQLAHKNAEGMLVVGGKVVKSSSNLEKLPTKKEIYRIAKERGFAPLLFIKDILIEEPGVPVGNSSWSRISTNDCCPTIEFYIGTGLARCTINPDRKALIGRELALRLLLTILLKADERETEIIK